MSARPNAPSQFIRFALSQGKGGRWTIARRAVLEEVRKVFWDHERLTDVAAELGMSEDSLHRLRRDFPEIEK